MCIQQHFVERLTTFEAYLSSASHGDGLTLRNFLEFHKKYSHLLPQLRQEHEPSEALFTALSPRNRSELIGLLLSYRILDVAAVLEDYPPLQLKHRRKVAFGDRLQVSDYI